ncbi:type II secretion system protein GspM [Paraburkholderia sp. ZP32-5]|uniref:type II secretion system protein GspM n=1 Tax=Paraburkholderia sp. ZP32-5 TaxID=2883245 RepID=UPI001F3C50F8|nr:type II secretion system protein GspM [Paraburkholderia sp. ZP32-5]
MDYRLGTARLALKTWFDERAPRERWLLAGGGGVMFAALVYSVLWAPAFDGRERIAARLPALEQGIADAQLQLEEARRLRAAAAVRAPAGTALREALAASLAQAGIEHAQLSVVGRGIQIDAKDAPFGVWMTWLDTVRRDDHVRVVNAHASAAAKPGVATVSATLEQSQ